MSWNGRFVLWNVSEGFASSDQSCSDSLAECVSITVDNLDNVSSFDVTISDKVTAKPTVSSGGNNITAKPTVSSGGNSITDYATVSSGGNSTTTNPTVGSGRNNITDHPTASSVDDISECSPSPSPVLSQLILSGCPVPPLPSLESSSSGDYVVPRGRAPQRVQKPNHEGHHSRSRSGSSGQSVERPSGSHKMPASVKSVPVCK